jgi:hypothetical protein
LRNYEKKGRGIIKGTKIRYIINYNVGRKKIKAKWVHSGVNIQVLHRYFWMKTFAGTSQAVR